MFRSLPLKFKLLLMLIVPMMLILGSMSIYSYYSSRSMLNYQIEQTVSYLVESNSGDIYSSLKEKEVLVSVLAQVLSQKQMNQAEEIAFLKQVKASGQGIQSAYTGYEDTSCADSQGVTQAEKPKGYDPRTREWYRVAQNANEIGYTDIYESTAKQLSVGTVKKIMRDGRVIGVAGIGMDIQPIHNAAKDIKIGETGYAVIMDAKGNFIYHPNFGLKDNVLMVDNGALNKYGSVFMSGKTSVQTGKVGGVEMLMAASPIGDTGWTFAVFVPKAEMLKQVNILGVQSLISSLLGLLLLGVIIFAITLKIVQRIKVVEDMAEKVANGDLTLQDKSVIDSNNGDEIDNLMRSFIDMKKKLRELISHVFISANKVAESAERFKEASQQSAEASTSVAASVTSVTLGSEAQVRASNEVAVVIASMSESIAEVAATANGMVKIVEKADSATDAGQNAIDSAISQMDNMVHAAKNAQEASGELANSSKQIGEIVELISNIAGQTNLLALNAAIEAARAGDQGRGFAVVADEVRKLAEQSERAAHQIALLIKANHVNIDNVVRSIETAISSVNSGVVVVGSASKEFMQISHMVKEVVTQAKAISDSMKVVAAGSESIVSSVHDVEKSCEEASGELQNVSAAAEEQSAAMEEITASCSVLAQLSEQLKEQVSKFKV